MQSVYPQREIIVYFRFLGTVNTVLLLKTEAHKYGGCEVQRYVGSLFHYFNVAVIPGFPDARICGRLPRFGTLVQGAEGRSLCGLGTFPALQILLSATADVPQVALSVSSWTCRARGCTL